MRKPKMNTGSFQEKFEKIVTEKRSHIVNRLLFYIAFKKGIRLDISNLTYQKEKVKNYSGEMTVFRYKGEIWLTEYPNGISTVEGYYYKSPFIN